MSLTSCGGLTVCNIDRHDVEVREGAEQVDALARGEPAPGRRAHARCARGVEHVHVEADVDGPASSLVAELGHPLPEAAAHQLVKRHDSVAEPVVRGTMPCAKVVPRMPTCQEEDASISPSSATCVNCVAALYLSSGS